MMKFASVIYNYSPKNEDELELKEGDEIEVLGYEEEGWWKGKLRGRTGVFPSNFVKVVEGVASSHGSQPAPASNQSSGLTPGNKLMNFLAKNSKTSPSSNSLNSNNSNSTSGNNNNNNNSYQNRIMNNTVQQQHPQQQGGSPSTPAVVGEDPAASERRPKPIRGVGYGDIFAAGAKPKLPPGSDIAGHTSNVDRLSSSLVNSLKHIPKKPPPPAPATTTDDNSGGSTNQAPALPPKPSPHFPHSKPYPPPPATPNTPTAAINIACTIQQLARREQARVIYAYEPSNDDELALEVGDVIDIIDKEIEDQGWWRGELKGKIGVFPDNFVQLIEVSERSNSAQSVTSATSLRDWNPRVTNHPSATIPSSFESKVKSVFDHTPKGFGKELESNLVKQNSPASFLSLKRNKLQQMTPSESPPDENSKKDDSPSNTTSKLNNITAGRAKGPVRRPPTTNLFSKRVQAEQNKPDLNGRDAPSMASLPASGISHPVPANHDSLSSLPAGQNRIINDSNQLSGMVGANFSQSSRPNSENIPHSSLVNSNKPIETVTDCHVINPKAHQRHDQQLKSYPPPPLTTSSSTAATTTATIIPSTARREQARVIYAYEPSNDDELALEVGDVIDIIDKEIEDQGWWRGELKGKIGVFPDNFVQLIEVPERTNPTQSVAKLHGTTAASQQDRGSETKNNPLPITQSSFVGRVKSVFDNAPKNFSKELETNLMEQSNHSSYLSLKRSKLQQIASSESPPSEDSKKDDSSSSSPSSAKLSQITAGRAKGPPRRPPTTNLFSKKAQTGIDRPDLNVEDEPSMASLPIKGVSSLLTDNDNILSSLPAGKDRISIGSNPIVSGNQLTPLSKPTPENVPLPSTVDTNKLIDTVPGSNVVNPKAHQRFDYQPKSYPPPPLTTSSSSASAAISAMTVQQLAKREQARVIYAYEPSNDDELALEVGDVIDIIDKEIEDQGWWRGELKGKIGVFPDNFVQLIEVPEQSATSPASHQNCNPRFTNQASTITPSSFVGKIKSVFEHVPQNATKDLESNIVKQNSPASFLSLKRSKLHQMATSESPPDDKIKKGESSGSSPPSTTPKLSHNIASRVKDLDRKPPTLNLLVKREQSEQDKPDHNVKDEPSMASLPVSGISPPVLANHDNLMSLPVEQNRIIDNSNPMSGMVGDKIMPLSEKTSERPLPSAVDSDGFIGAVTNSDVINPKAHQHLDHRTKSIPPPEAAATVATTNAQPFQQPAQLEQVRVIYVFEPSTDEKLALEAGDVIDIVEKVEEEGWWKGKLRGRTGVFPSNFVKVVEGVASSHGSQPAPASNQSSGLTPGNKLMNFLAKNSKTSPSSNSLNSNNSNSTSGNNNNNNNSYQNRIMNNTVQQQHPQQQGGSPSTPAVVGEDPAASERRPKPIRGVGYGDIFAAGAKPKLPPGSDIAGHTSNVDRLSSSLVNSLKHIPKKPPPPAPATTTDDNSGGSTNQAPALPPKPSPHFPHSKPYPPPPATTSLPPVTTTNTTSVQQLARREPARSIHAHEKSNDDELALGAGGVIETIDKGLEDRGWWKSNLIN